MSRVREMLVTVWKVNTYGGSRELDALHGYVEHTTHKLLDEEDNVDRDHVTTFALLVDVSLVLFVLLSALRRQLGDRQCM